MNLTASVMGGMVILPYSVSYLVKLGVDDTFANLSVTFGAAEVFFVILGVAYLSDHLGRLNVIRVGTALVIVTMVPYFLLLNTLNPLWIVLAQMMMYGISQSTVGPIAALYAESFPTKYRYSGAGVTYQLAQLVTGGIGLSLVLPLSIVAYGVVGSWVPIAVFAIAMCILGIVTSFFVKETRGIALE
jgi:MFS family permease